MTQTVLITGALTGIGRATAELYARDGVNLAISGRRAAEGEALAAELRKHGGAVEFFAADVRHEAEVEALVAKVLQRFGGLDVAVNNAGTEGKTGPLAEQTVENYAATFDTNVLGVFLSLKHELKAMLAAGKGAIVNVSSFLGSRGAPGAGIYAASKHAVEGLTRVAALEGAAAGVRVNAVAPGPVATAMLDRFAGSADRVQAMAAGIPLRRTGTPEEIAATIRFLGSDAAGYVTGQVLGADGGKTA
jgi:NAD(P)-dependent dehydrogenase (short-subunit alcohol dehydrogenase family)